MAGFALGFLVFFKKRKEEVEELLNMTYGERLKYLRNLRHMTQADLGLSCGFMNRGDVRIAQYESKKRYPREEVNIKLAKALGVNPKVLRWNVDDDKENLYYQLLWMLLKEKNLTIGEQRINTIVEEYCREMKELKNKLDEQKISMNQYMEHLLNRELQATACSS